MVEVIRLCGAYSREDRVRAYYKRMVDCTLKVQSKFLCNVTMVLYPVYTLVKKVYD